MTEQGISTEPRDHRAREWWRSVCDPLAGDAAARARLRRCRDTIDVLSIPAGIRLARMLGVAAKEPSQVDGRFDRALDLARVLAHVTADASKHPMRDVGYPAFPGDRRESDIDHAPKLSEARFRRLLQSESGEDLVAQFTRLISLMGGTANVAAISDAFRWWDHPGGRIRQQWAFEYFNAGAAMRSTNLPPENSRE